ncbi:hypothetical protein ACH4C2_04100 [Streptomyces sp. NPDC018057]|uniref:hypothetical protein n=1 Tax=unclassified Streptomyces TaxID=2593676 RepID=UPI00379F0B34
MNVGHGMYGDIHIHPPVPADGRHHDRRRTLSPISAARHAEVRSALISLVHACERAVAALSSTGLPWPEGRSEDHDID